MPDPVTPQITVRGSSTARHRPELATVQVRVGLEGAAPDEVHADATRSQAALTETLEPLHDPQDGPVTWWASDQVRTWAERPWRADGPPLPLVHHAQVDLQATFADFAVLSRWITGAMTVPGVSVDRIAWALTEDRRRALVDEVRTAAVRDARERAQAYADALDLGPVRVRALADAGMLGLAPQAGQSGTEMAMYARGADLGGGGDLAFTPQDVAVTTEVDAVFVVA